MVELYNWVDKRSAGIANLVTWYNSEKAGGFAAVKQKVDKNGSEINLLASFENTSAGISIKAIRDNFLKKIQSKIQITADNITAEAQESISLLAKDTIVAEAKKVTIAGIFESTDAAFFKRDVHFENTVFMNSVCNFNKDPVFNTGFKVADNQTALFQGKVNINGENSSLYVHGTKIDSDTFLKPSDINQAMIINALKGTHKTLSEYIRSIIGCKDGNNVISLSDYIANHHAAKHTHTVNVKTTQHYHKQADGKYTEYPANATATVAATTSSNS